MSSKRRLRAIACDGKVKHKTMLAARISARKTDRRCVGYKCKFCSGFHVGHRPAKQKKRRQKGHE